MTAIPQTTPASIKKGDAGTAVWALQRALGDCPHIGAVVEDGSFGDVTEVKVKRFQSTRNLTPDGVAGPKTQARLARSLIAVADPDHKTPEGLLRSVVEGESANYIAAVNWSVAGGVDCGYTQRRVYEPYVDADVKRAFDSLYQLRLLRAQLQERKAHYYYRPAVANRSDRTERAWRLAVYHHNHPAGARKLGDVPESSLTEYWRTPQQWVVAIGARFDDGTPVNTPLQWAKFYSLGDPAHKHKGRMVYHVEEFS